LPARLDIGVHMEQRKANLTAANGTKIQVQGFAAVPFSLDDQHLHETLMVTADEIMLGQSFICNRDASWNFNQKTILINGIAHQLHCNSQQTTCRRVYTANDLVIPPLSHVTISTHSPIRSWSGQTGNCIIDTHEPVNGLFVARSIVPSTSIYLPVTVCNTRDAPMHMREGTSLGMTEPIECMNDDISCQSSVKQIITDRNTEVHRLIDNIINNLPNELTTNEVQSMRNILWKYSKCLSINEFDLGYTDLVEHTINTGNAAPIRQTTSSTCSLPDTNRRSRTTYVGSRCYNSFFVKKVNIRFTRCEM
jgi:hypothetical protein